MSLLSAFGAARSALSANATQTAIVSRNIADVGQTGISRKVAVLSTGANGIGFVASISRAADAALQKTALAASSAASAQSVISTALNSLDPTTGAQDTSATLSSRLSALTTALTSAAASPDNTEFARAAVDKAKDVVSGLNAASATIQTVREGADADIATSVAAINELLADFGDAEGAVLAGRNSGADVTDAQDKRDQALSSLAAQIGIRTATRTDGSTLITTDSGAVLFDRSPRTVSFKASATLPAGTAGAAVFVDGTDVTSASSPMRIASGAIAGAVEVRDTIATTYQSQVDEIARGLITAFKESDTSGSKALPDAAGLFTWPGGPALPGAGTATGLAGSITVNANVDPDKGGNLRLLRDGGISDPGNAGYTSNATGATGYSDRLSALASATSVSQSFDASARLVSSASLSGFADSSAAWLSASRSSASTAADQQSATRDRTQLALSNATGISLDDEMSRLLDLEHAYAASAKLLSTVDSLYDTLFQAVSR